MSKNNQYKLKEVKEMNIKYNGAKDVEIISPTYSKIQKSLNKGILLSNPIKEFVEKNMKQKSEAKSVFKSLRQIKR